MALLGREKPVLVAVYVEKPKRISLLPSNTQVQRHRHHHHHLHHHLYVHRARQHGPRGRGYNRRADLLEYSRNLRESAHSAASTPLLQHSSPESHSNQRSQKQVNKNKGFMSKVFASLKKHR